MDWRRYFPGCYTAGTGWLVMGHRAEWWLFDCRDSLYPMTRDKVLTIYRDRYTHKATTPDSPFSTLRNAIAKAEQLSNESNKRNS